MSNIDIVRGAYAAFASGDIPGLLGAMAPDIVWNEAENFPYSDNNPYVGPEAILGGVFARIGADWDGFTATPHEIIDGGDTIIALGRYGGVYKATGKRLDAQMVHVWRVKNGKLTSFQQYTDTLQSARVTGASG